MQVEREADYLIFEGRVEKEWEEAVGGVSGIKVNKKSLENEKVKLHIRESEGMDMLDEADRSICKTASVKASRTVYEK